MFKYVGEMFHFVLVNFKFDYGHIYETKTEENESRQKKKKKTHIFEVKHVVELCF